MRGIITGFRGGGEGGGWCFNNFTSSSAHELRFAVMGEGGRMSSNYLCM